MRDKNISSLIEIDKYSKPTGIVTERDLVRKICLNDASSSRTIIKDILSSPLTTIDSLSPVDVAADIMIRKRVRHLLVVNNDDINKPLGIITPTDFVGYLKENLNIDDVNVKILESLRERGQKDSLGEHQVIEALEQQSELPKDVQKGGEQYESEEPRQG